VNSPEFERVKDLIVYTAEIKSDGVLSHPESKELSIKIEEFLETIGVARAAKRRAFYAAVEMLQVITSIRKERNVKFFFKQGLGKIYILAEMPVLLKFQIDLVKFIDEINNLSTNKQKINQFLRDYLKGKNLNKKVRGSLSLIELVRKSGSKLLYKIEDFDTQYKRLSLIVTVDIE
jgi:hypothetical protein